MKKQSPWPTEIGAIVGLVAGVVIWWSTYRPGEGLLRTLQLLIVPAAFGMFVVNLRNRRNRVGPYDPETIERNKRGVL